MLRHKALRALFITLFLGVFSYRPASAAVYVDASLQVDAGIFHEDLAPYGEWVDVADYGWVWAPRVAVGWRPYTRGHWVWTDDDGWLWVSDENFGWAVYHYGRWSPDPNYGWVWVPGNEWAPAWVSWRHGDGYIGWAPLSPRVTWSVGIGFNVGGAQIDAFVSPRAYCFVPERSFTDTAIYRNVVPYERNTTLISTTTNLTSYTAVQGRVVNRGVAVAQVERATGRPVPRSRVVEANSLQAARHADQKGGAVTVFRPQVRQAAGNWPAHGTAVPKAGSTQSQPVRAQARAGRPNGDGRVQSDQRPADKRMLQERKPQDTQSRRATQQVKAEQQATEKRQAQERKQQDTQSRQAAQQAKAEQQATEKRLAQERKQQDAQKRQAAQQVKAEQQATEKRLAQERKQQDTQFRQVAQQHQAQQRAAEKQLAQQNKQQAAERKTLEKTQAQERQNLERQHQQEAKRPPQNVASQDLVKRQEQQHQAIAARQAQEQRALQARQQQQREQPAPPAAVHAAQNRPQVAAQPRVAQPQPQPKKPSPTPNKPNQR